jgi:uncharacterized membrane protein YhaH (DUF805 family)
MPCHRLSLGALILVLAAFLAGLALTTGSAALVVQRAAAVDRAVLPVSANGLTLHIGPATLSHPS